MQLGMVLGEMRFLNLDPRSAARDSRAVGVGERGEWERTRVLPEFRMWEDLSLIHI